MTDSQRIAEIEAREKAATEGPWEWEAADDSQLGLHRKGELFEASLLVCNRCDSCRDSGINRCGWPNQENGDFIAAARADIPFLLEKLREAQAVIEKCVPVLDIVKSYGCECDGGFVLPDGQVHKCVGCMAREAAEAANAPESKGE